MKTILVLFGGCSTEYEVSLHSAYAVLSHMDPARYTPLAVGITREGQWLCYTGDLSRLEDGTWQQAADCIPCTPLVEREAHALLLLDGSGRRLLFDAVFPVLHGKNGEDGTVQGLFELAGVPVIGCGTLSSALCMDKDRAHQLRAWPASGSPGATSFIPAMISAGSPRQRRNWDTRCLSSRSGPVPPSVLPKSPGRKSCPPPWRRHSATTAP